MNNTIQLIECPRDAMQGWQHFIPTEKKIQYLNSLLQVGFDAIDFGSNGYVCSLGADDPNPQQLKHHLNFRCGVPLL